MRKKTLIGFIKVLAFITSVICFPIITNAAESDLDVDGFEIMPKLTSGEVTEINKKIQEIGKTGGNVRKEYNKAASELSTSEQISSGIMTRDTILNYIVFIVKFLSQLGLLVGAGFIIFAGYKYMLSIFNGGKTPSSTLTNAIIGVVIVIFSYAIMKILTSIIGLT